MTLPVEVNPLLASSSGGYTIARSLRFRFSASAYLSRTPVAASNQQKWTWSAWIKRGLFSGGSNCHLFDAGYISTGVSASWFYIVLTSDKVNVVYYDGASNVVNLATTAVLRDPSAWYHLVVSLDTTQATASNRLSVYINGVQVTSFSTATYPALNATYPVNSTYQHRIGARSSDGFGDYQYFDGYLAEVNFIDGQQLTSSSFGVIDNNGIWQPKAYTGTYGTNGFYLKFSDNSAATAAAIGKDSSGNGNNWTPNNISVTAGVTYDSMLDTPTVNYATWNPINHDAGTGTPVVARSLTDGNLGLAYDATNWSGYRSTFGMRSGKWYMEVNCSAGGGSFNTALQLIDASQATGTAAIVGIQPTAGSNILAIALDVDNLTYSTYRNNTLISSGTIVPSSDYPEYMFRISNGNGVNTFANFGQRPFTYTPPAGYNAVSSSNLSTPTVLSGAQYMAASTYTGTGTTQSVVNSGNNPAARSFQPDLVWSKSRSNAINHTLFDSVRGVYNGLISNATNAEINDTASLTAFNSNGFALGASNLTLLPNYPSYTYIAWQWQAGQGTTTVNTSGTITSNVSVNQSAGFSIATFTSPSTGGSSPSSFGHGLGVTPALVIVKSRTNIMDWYVYHQSLGNTKVSYLNGTAAAATSSTSWNNTSPTSSIVTLGTQFFDIGTVVAYCWSEVAGYSKFGSYTGNGAADGPFVYCGFRPRFILIKNINDGTRNWWIMDTSRDTYNLAINELRADSSAVELTTAYSHMDILSNGFKIRAASAETNGSGNIMIFAAFAENPFKISRAR